jgi:hypothetical protein
MLKIILKTSYCLPHTIVCESATLKDRLGRKEMFLML